MKTHLLSRPVSAISIVLGGLLACEAPVDAPDPAPTIAYFKPKSDQRTQGPQLNGERWAGDGARETVSRVAYAGVRLAGAPVENVRFVNGRLRGSLTSGQLVEGVGWQGAVFIARNDRSAYTLTVKDVRLDDLDDAFVLERNDGQGSIGFCDTSQVDALKSQGAAVALPLVWDAASGVPTRSATHFTLACPLGATAKCHHFGYRHAPGAPDEDRRWRSHWACTRAVRADYCGNGASHTIEGLEIDVFDLMGLDPNSSGIDPFEAAWSPEGATCVHHWRVADMIPTCVEKLQASCDSPEAAAAIAPGGIVFTESALPL